jgi:hypothetical protein
MFNISLTNDLSFYWHNMGKKIKEKSTSKFLKVKSVFSFNGSVILGM